MLKGLISRFQKPQAVQLPGYAALGVIRQGSLSMIFKAREQATGRIVAVKVHKPAARKAGDRPDVAHLTLTEGQVVASLNHPNVVRCFTHGFLAEMPYAVLEYIEGAPLSSLTGADAGQLAGLKLEIVRQAAMGLAHVHARRFVHRDFCPKNLLVTGDGVVKLIDFGIAAPLGAVPVSGYRPESIQFLPPEVLKRDLNDHRVDIFSWGIVAYQTLSGVWPFEQAGQQPIVSKILNAKAVPLDKRLPDLPAEVAAIIMRCIEKDPANRPSGMNVVVGVLDRYREAAI
jgi:serine/threonine protein kinase